MYFIQQSLMTYIGRNCGACVLLPCVPLGKLGKQGEVRLDTESVMIGINEWEFLRERRANECIFVVDSVGGRQPSAQVRDCGVLFA